MHNRLKVATVQGLMFPSLTKSDIKHLHINTSGKVLEIFFIMPKVLYSSYVITKRNKLYFDCGWSQKIQSIKIANKVLV